MAANDDGYTNPPQGRRDGGDVRADEVDVEVYDDDDGGGWEVVDCGRLGGAVCWEIYALRGQPILCDPLSGRLWHSCLIRSSLAAQRRTSTRRPLSPSLTSPASPPTSCTPRTTNRHDELPHRRNTDEAQNRRTDKENVSGEEAYLWTSLLISGSRQPWRRI